MKIALMPAAVAFKTCDDGYVKVYVIVYVHQVGCSDWVSISIEDACVHVVFDGRREAGH